MWSCCCSCTDTSSVSPRAISCLVLAAAWHPLLQLDDVTAHDLLFFPFPLPSSAVGWWQTAVSLWIFSCESLSATPGSFIEHGFPFSPLLVARLAYPHELNKYILTTDTDCATVKYYQHCFNLESVNLICSWEPKGTLCKDRIFTVFAVWQSEISFWYI